MCLRHKDSLSSQGRFAANLENAKLTHAVLAVSRCLWLQQAVTCPPRQVLSLSLRKVA